MKRLHLPLLTLVTLLTSCHFFDGHRIHGDGHIVNQARNFSRFDKVEIGGAMHLEVTEDSTFSVNVEADNNLQQFIDVYLDGSTLHVHPQDGTNLEGTREIIIHVHAPLFNALSESGACRIRSTNPLHCPNGFSIDASGASHAILDINTPALKSELSGACSLELRGQGKELNLEGAGSTSVDAFEFLAENVSIHLSGAGSANVFASVKLDADASGAAHINYKGNPAVNSDVSGAGTVRKM